MVSTSEFRNGMVLRLDGDLYYMVEFEHFKPGKGAAVVRTRLKRVKTGAMIDRTFRSGDKVDDVRLERRKMQFLYQSGDLYCFMDSETYDQYELSPEVMGNAVKYLKENEILEVLVAEQNAVSVALPIFVELEVTETDPGLRGDTASGGSKPGRAGNRSFGPGAPVCGEGRRIENRYPNRDVRRASLNLKRRNPVSAHRGRRALMHGVLNRKRIAVWQHVSENGRSLPAVVFLKERA